MGKADKFTEIFSCKFELSAAKAKMGKAAEVVLEAKVIGIVEDRELTVEAKRKALQNLQSSVGNYSRLYGADLKNTIHRTLMTEAMNRVVSKDD